MRFFCWEVKSIATNLIEEISTKISRLPPERQREALAWIEQLAARSTPSDSSRQRAARKLKGATSRGRSVSSEEIRLSRREMWGDYVRKDEP